MGEMSVTVIGPECFASEDESVICWKGRNYVPQPDPDAPLDGATDPGPENAFPSTPGEFAARWNALTDEQRVGFLRAMVAADEASVRCRMLHQQPRQYGTVDQLIRDTEADD